jgi:hypothetical protein
VNHRQRLARLEKRLIENLRRASTALRPVDAGPRHRLDPHAWLAFVEDRLNLEGVPLVERPARRGDAAAWLRQWESEAEQPTGCNATKLG